jgi:hypothetical protein
LLSPGDVVVVHPLTAHGVGLVLSTGIQIFAMYFFFLWFFVFLFKKTYFDEHTAIRYQLFYRMYHKKHDESKIELLDDISLIWIYLF